MCKYCGQETAPCQCGGLPFDSNEALLYGAILLHEKAEEYARYPASSPDPDFWSLRAAEFTERAKVCAALASARAYLSLGVPRQRALARIT